MNTTAIRRPAAPQPLLSIASRLAVAAAVAGALVLASMEARHASTQAVLAASHHFATTPVQVTLDTVQVVGRREAGDARRI